MPDACTFTIEPLYAVARFLDDSTVLLHRHDLEMLSLCYFRSHSFVGRLIPDYNRWYGVENMDGQRRDHN
jgi:hypothetical protein